MIILLWWASYAFESNIYLRAILVQNANNLYAILYNKSVVDRNYRTKFLQYDFGIEGKIMGLSPMRTIHRRVGVVDVSGL